MNLAINQLEKLAVKASLVAPILLNNNLYGFLIAHQCSALRQWQDLEVNLLQQLAIPVGYALEQESLLKHVDQVSSLAEQVVSEHNQQNAALQEQIMKLLNQLEGTFRGDLTLQAEVTMKEFAPIADLLNTLIESFRDVVTKIKASANEINASAVSNEALSVSLTETEVKLVRKINQDLLNMEFMTLSMQQVSENAQKVLLFTETASHTALTTETLMEQNAQNIFKLRSTIGDIDHQVKILGKSAQQMSQIMNLMNQIATQSKVLAVNIGLEAARESHEQNEDITVIASEIDELAVRCAEASQRIEEIVGNIQREANLAITTIEQGTVQVVESTHLVEQAKSSWGEIIGLSSQIEDLVQSISLATTSGVKISQAATKSMKEISQFSQMTRNSSHQISRSLQKTVEITQKLQANVDNFKVS
jgi:twitching motility protein PilJ